MDGVELVRLLRQQATVALVFQPLPLEEGRFVQRGWRVVVQLVQLGRAIAVIGKIQATVEMRVAATPAFGDPVTERFRDGQLRHQRLAAYHFVNQIQRHGMQLGAGVFDIVLDLAQGERVIRAFIPVRRTVDGMETEPRLGGTVPPVAALGNCYTLHCINRRRCCGRRCANQNHHGWR